MRIDDANLLPQVVNYLNNHREAKRIKKMLYCLCTNRWEKDADYLNSINSQYLIEQIVREHDSLEQLKILLQNLIKTVNKPEHYVNVAKTIYLAIGQLYPEFNQEHANKSPARTPIPEPTVGYTQDIPSSLQRAYAPAATVGYTNQDIPSSVQRAYAPAPTQASYTNQDLPSSLQRAYAPEPTQQFEEHIPPDYSINEADYETYYDPEAGEGESLNPGEMPEYDPFVLRQNVMSYTNPLRAKIILSIMLHPQFNFGNQSAVTMREYNLDDLLFEVLRAYPTVPELEESITSAVEQLVEVEEYGKAATGLLQSLIPLYSHR